MDANKEYASELLAIMLQTSEVARKKLTEKLDGVDMLLRVHELILYLFPSRLLRITNGTILLLPLKKNIWKICLMHSALLSFGRTIGKNFLKAKDYS